VVKKSESLGMQFSNGKVVSPLTAEMILPAISGKEDRFAKTFIAKSNAMNLWGVTSGLVDHRGNLLAIIATTYTKRTPKVANLQLLHSFHKYRGQGHARLLCQISVAQALEQGCKYFRVSAEPEAVPFYEKIGFKFVGRQKSNCQLSIFPLTHWDIRANNIKMDDYIRKTIVGKKKGCCVEIFT
jgi:GNAT superfamily N-acetyltransferase